MVMASDTSHIIAPDSAGAHRDVPIAKLEVIPRLDTAEDK